MGRKALIDAISVDSAQLATDQATLAALQASVQAAQDAIAADTTNSSAADAALSTDLQTNGPEFLINPDGSATFYEFATTAPGYVIVVAQPAT